MIVVVETVKKLCEPVPVRDEPVVGWKTACALTSNLPFSCWQPSCVDPKRRDGIDRNFLTVSFGNKKPILPDKRHFAILTP